MLCALYVVLRTDYSRTEMYILLEGHVVQFDPVIDLLPQRAIDVYQVYHEDQQP